MNSKQTPGEAYDYIVKILILGDSAVGKTALLQKFHSNTFTSQHLTTIGVDFKYKIVNVDGKLIKMQIWDTAGQEKYRSIVEAYYKGALGIILAYSIADRKSFQNIEKWMEQIYHKAASDAVVILVGLKCDLDDTRVVDYTDGKRVADKYNLKFMEVSSKNGTNVSETFMTLGMQLRDKLKDDLYLQAKKVIQPGTMNEGHGLKLQTTKQEKTEDGGEQITEDKGSKCRC